jgi:probable phosphoglycerate mutase
VRALVLVRHGQTEWSAAGRHTGRTDVPLTDEGAAQARALAPRLAVRSFALVLVSPRRRARDTARLAGVAELAEVDDDLAEWDYGDYEGRTSDEIHETDPGWTIWPAGAPGGETPAQVAARADRVIARALAADGDVLLVAHGHLLRVLTARWLGLEAAGGRYFRLEPATLSELGYERDQRVIERWNS